MVRIQANKHIKINRRFPLSEKGAAVTDTEKQIKYLLLVLVGTHGFPSINTDINTDIQDRCV